MPVLASADTASPFSLYIQDIAPAQRKVITEFIARLREQMVTTLSKLDVPLPTPSMSGLWAIRSTLLNVDIALVEIGPRYMRGYGEVDPEAGRMLRGVVAELEKTLQRLSNYLAEGEDQRFGAHPLIL